MKLLLLLLKGAKLGKIAASGGTMILSVAVYATVFGWRYAAGFVSLLMVHELGHLLAARQRGLPAGLPMFIPFVGAWITLAEVPRDAETEAFVGLGGPLLGTIGAVACWWVANETGTHWLLAVAYAGFFLNLFNLIPVPPLDGGRITAVLSPRIWLLGVPVLVAMFCWRPSPMLIMIGVLAAPQIWHALRSDPQSDEVRAYYDVSDRVRWEYALYYIGLLAFLGLMTHETWERLRAVGY